MPVHLAPLPPSAVGDLLTAAEGTTALPRAALFTGAHSTADLRLHRRHGYTEVSRETLRPGLELVHLVKRPVEGLA